MENTEQPQTADHPLPRGREEFSIRGRNPDGGWVMITVQHDTDNGIEGIGFMKYAVTSLSAGIVAHLAEHGDASAIAVLEELREQGIELPEFTGSIEHRKGE